jgi:hypothetical protein
VVSGRQLLAGDHRRDVLPYALRPPLRRISRRLPPPGRIFRRRHAHRPPVLPAERRRRFGVDACQTVRRTPRSGHMPGLRVLGTKARGKSARLPSGLSVAALGAGPPPCHLAFAADLLHLPRPGATRLRPLPFLRSSLFAPRVFAPGVAVLVRTDRPILPREFARFAFRGVDRSNQRRTKS